jgi:hypothetical protein
MVTRSKMLTECSMEHTEVVTRSMVLTECSMEHRSGYQRPWCWLHAPWDMQKWCLYHAP